MHQYLDEGASASMSLVDRELSRCFELIAKRVRLMLTL